MSLFYAWLMFWLTMHSGLEVTLLPNCESFFHCLSASGDAGEKLGVILIPDSLDALVFPFLKLVESSYFEILVWYPLIWITVISEAGYQVGPFSQNSHSSILGKFSETIFWCFLPLVFFLYFSENLFNLQDVIRPLPLVPRYYLLPPAKKQKKSLHTWQAFDSPSPWKKLVCILFLRIYSFRVFHINIII